MANAEITGRTAPGENLRAISSQSGIILSEHDSGETFSVTGSGVSVIENFRSGQDKIVLPESVDLSRVTVTADWQDDAWGLRITYSAEGQEHSSVFLRWGHEFDLALDLSSGSADESVSVEAPPADLPEEPAAEAGADAPVEAPTDLPTTDGKEVAEQPDKASGELPGDVGAEAPADGGGNSGTSSNPDGEVNVLIRGQSNAQVFAGWGGGGAELEHVLEEKLGTDVHILASFETENGQNTINSATRFMDWQQDGLQQGLIDFLDAQPESIKDNPTLTVWMHNEYDQQSMDLTTDQWVSAVREDAELVRAALGQDATTTPYEFVPIRYPYGGNFDAIGNGMEALSADIDFNADLSWSAQDAVMDGDGFAGSSHMGNGDAQAIGRELGEELSSVLVPLAGPRAGEDVPTAGYDTVSGAPAETADPVDPVDTAKLVEEPTGEAPDGYTLVLSDDFSEGYKTGNWGDPYDGGVYWNGAWSWSAGDVAVNDGVLEVSATRHSDGWWTGGGLNSMKADKTITYGIIELDAKVPEVQGVMGVLLTWPASDQWPVDGEIDLLETPDTEVMHTSHGVDGSGNHSYESVRNSAYDETQWNHYKLTWLPDYLALEVNGNVVAEWTDPAFIPDVAHGIGAMVNVASANDAWMGSPPDPNGPSEMVMQIDNVRMYQADGIL